MDCNIIGAESQRCDSITVKIEEEHEKNCAFDILRLRPDVPELVRCHDTPDMCNIEMQPVKLNISLQTEFNAHCLDADKDVPEKCYNNTRQPKGHKTSTSNKTLKCNSLSRGHLEPCNRGAQRDCVKPLRIGKKSSTPKQPERQLASPGKKLVFTKNKRSKHVDKVPIPPETNTTGDGKHFRCHICKKEFMIAGHLTRHIRVHSGERPFKCNECGKAFKDSSVLTRHQRIHSQQRPYKCKVCKKTFIQSKDLKYHQSVHTGDRPYQCETCNKTFSSASYLTVHKRTHTGEKPFTCEICNQSFTGSTTLSRHHRTHTGEKPYKCSLCRKAFTRPATLKQHQKSQHEDLSDNSLAETSDTNSDSDQYTTVSSSNTKQKNFKLNLKQ